MTFKTRFSAKLSKRLNLEDARNAIFNWALAKKNGGEFYLRIEDQYRTDDNAHPYTCLFRDLRSLGITWCIPEIQQGIPGHLNNCLKPRPMWQPTYTRKWETIPGVVYSSLRGNRYLQVASDLTDKGLAYFCFMSPEELRKNERHCMVQHGRIYKCDSHRHLSHERKLKYWKEGRLQNIRLNVEAVQQATGVEGLDGCPDFVLLHSGRKGADLEFARSVDDADMAINHVVSCEETGIQTKKQRAMYAALGFKEPTKFFVPSLVDPDSKKFLIESAKDFRLEKYFKGGYLPEALFDYLGSLGQSADGKIIVQSRKKFIENFDIKKYGRPFIDLSNKKLNWVQKKRMQCLSIESKVDGIIRYLGKKVTNTKAVRNFVIAAGNRLKTFEDARVHSHFWDDSHFVIQERDAYILHYDNFFLEVLLKIQKLVTVYNGPWDSVTLGNVLGGFVKYLANTYSNPPLFHKKIILALRIVTAGSQNGIGLYEGMAILGKRRFVERMDQTVKYIQEHKLARALVGF